MSKVLVVGISDYKHSRHPDVLVTYALGSCVGICLYDIRTRIGGLSHIMLPESQLFAQGEFNRMKFADTAIVDLIKEMKAKGANPGKLTAKIAGGAQMFAVQKSTTLGAIGERNIKSVKQMLQSLRIPIIAEDTGENYGRTVYFHLESGRMKVQSLNRRVKEF